VTDPSGAIIAGVKVEATNVETNILFSGETNAEGRYHIPDLPPGMYRVIVRKFAFQTIVKPLMAVRIEIAPSLCRLRESFPESQICNSGTSPASQECSPLPQVRRSLFPLTRCDGQHETMILCDWRANKFMAAGPIPTLVTIGWVHLTHFGKIQPPVRLLSVGKVSFH
jgi:hypothetical protein